MGALSVVVEAAGPPSVEVEDALEMGLWLLEVGRGVMQPSLICFVCWRSKWAGLVRGKADIVLRPRRCGAHPFAALGSE
eukprot:1138600-Pelagomonas_calceolata.AAC.7